MIIRYKRGIVLKNFNTIILEFKNKKISTNKDKLELLALHLLFCLVYFFKDHIAI